MKISKIKPYHNDDYFKTEHLKANLKNRAVRGAGLTVFSQISSYFIQMISVIILARLLTPDDFGVVAMGTSITAFFLMFRRLGLTDATVQRENITHRQISTLFWINAAFSLGLTLLLMAMSPLISWFYGEKRLVLIMVISSLGFIIGGLATQHLALLKRNMQFFQSTIIEISSAIISVAGSICMALFGCGYWAIVGRPLVLTLVSTIGAWIFCKWRPGLPAYGTGVKPMLKFGMFYLANNTVNYFSQNLDKILIGRRYGAESLGFYDKSYQLFLAPAQQLSYPLASVANSTLSRLVNEPDKYRRYYLKAVSMISFIAFPLSAILSITGRDIVFLLLGPQWGRAGEIFSIFSLGIGIQMLYPTHAWLHITMGRTDRLFRWGIFNAIIIVLSFLIGLPFGSIGVAFSYTVAIYVLIGPCLWYAGKPVSLSLSAIASVIWRYLFCGFCSGFICWYLSSSFELTSNILIGINVFLRIILLSLFCITIYLIFIIIIFQNIKPISQFISMIGEMLPNVLSKKTK